jgi:hypothetical protein
MRIILVHWKIRPGREDEFIAHWSTISAVADRSGLVGEFLTVPDDPVVYPWITWPLDPSYRTFINIGLWRDGAAFQEQFGRHINDCAPLLPFEAERRTRILVEPKAWRTGAAPLPTRDSEGAV